jgi:hypothetical protein
MDIPEVTVDDSDLAQASVEAIALFGSHSRGDADDASDVDYVVFGNAQSAEGLVRIKDSLVARHRGVNFSLYSMSTAKLMAADGSLFLWHLALEGRIVFRRSVWIDGLLQEVQPYSRDSALRDLHVLDTVLEDVGKGLQDDLTLWFETSTLYSVARTVGMIATMLKGDPSFRRLEPIERLNGYVIDSDQLSGLEIAYLAKSRAVYCRNQDRQFVISLANSRIILRKIKLMLGAVREVICESLFAHA